MTFLKSILTLLTILVCMTYIATTVWIKEI